MSAFHSPFQHTLNTAVRCTGIGLHSGAPVHMRLTPAEEDTGILFKRTDVSAPISYVPAQYDRVTDTMLGTTIANEHGVAVSTIEHLMAALWGCGVDNAIIELDAPEVPIMDGSSNPFVFLVECAGVAKQSTPRTLLKVMSKLDVKDGASTATILPFGGFALNVTIEFPNPIIARQQAQYDFGRVSFKQMLSRARTFGFAHEVEKMRALGLARGGSLENAIVVDNAGILNEGGLRYADEFVRHKALDCVGDYFLAGARILGEVATSRPGHGINNKLMRALMTTPGAVQRVNAEDVFAPVPQVMHQSVLALAV